MGVMVGAAGEARVGTVVEGTSLYFWFDMMI